MIHFMGMNLGRRHSVRVAGTVGLLLGVILILGIAAAWLTQPRSFDGKTVREHLASLSAADLHGAPPDHPGLRTLLALPPEQSVPELVAILNTPPGGSAWGEAWQELLAQTKALLGQPFPAGDIGGLPDKAKAAAVLGLIGPEAAPAQPALVKLLNSPNFEVAGHAMEALEATGLPDDQLIARLLPLITGPYDTPGGERFFHPYRAMAALQQRPSALAASVDQWMPLARDAGNPGRVLALEALTQVDIPDNARLGPLTDALDVNAPGEFAVAADWFGQFTAPLPGPVEERLQRGLRSEDREVRLAAARALLRHEGSHPQAEATLDELAHAPELDDADTWTQLLAYEGMWRARAALHDHDPAAYPLQQAFAEELPQASPARRLAAIEAFVERHPDRAEEIVPPLTELATSLQWGLHHEAFILLQNLGPAARDALPQLRAVQDHPSVDPGEVRMVIRAIEGSGPASVTKPLAR